MAPRKLDVFPHLPFADSTKDVAICFQNDFTGLQRYWRAKVASVNRHLSCEARQNTLDELDGQRDDVHDILMHDYRWEPYQDEPIEELEMCKVRRLAESKRHG